MDQRSWYYAGTPQMSCLQLEVFKSRYQHLPADKLEMMLATFKLCSYERQSGLVSDP